MKKTLLVVLAMLLNIALFSQTKITNNPVLVINAGNSVTCNSAGILVTDNSFFQIYDLDNYSNIVDTAFFVRMKVGCEETSGGAYQIVGAVYNLVGTPILANMTFISDDTIAVYPDSSNYKIDILFDQGYALPGDSLASEMKLPTSTTVSFYPGSNTSPESSPTYIVATGCAINDLTTVSSLGFPTMHLIMNLYVNQKPTTTDFSASTFKNDSVYFQSSDYTSNFSDNDNDGLTMIRITTLPTNGILDLNGVTLVVGDSVNTSDLDQLLYIPNNNYFGSDAFTYNVRDTSHWSNTPAMVDINVINWQLGVSENEINNITLYPNPTSDVINLKTTENLNSILVVDMNGRFVNATITGKQINVTSVEAGSYFIIVELSNGSIQRLPFVKQ